ncbi:hypothetical protein SDC9_171382 [bioreactor metagenome]|uniref:Uncharacterized protein n=1 Tax=bioreactor metagenome TaxID=1076179 RepID=A0A645GDY6_9ZZZZ
MLQHVELMLTTWMLYTTLTFHKKQNTMFTVLDVLVVLVKKVLQSLYLHHAKEILFVN